MNNKDNKTFEHFFEKVTLPFGIEKAIESIDWSVKDVLVGSLGSVKQLQDNLARNYYYVPEKYISDKNLPVHYIALYQSKTMFGNQTGIRYYGEVSLTKRVMRKDINFPLHRNNGDEWYYAFMVNGWQQLPAPISGQYQAVFEPKFTNLFLLTNCNQSYELFSVESSAQFCLLHVIKRIYSECSEGNDLHFETAFQAKNGNSLWAHDGYFEIVDSNGNKLLDSPVKITDFSKNPQKIFFEISDALGIIL